MYDFFFLFYFTGTYVGPSIPLTAANVATNGSGSPLRPRTSPPPPPPPSVQEANQEGQQSNHHQVNFFYSSLKMRYIWIDLHVEYVIKSLVNDRSKKDSIAKKVYHTLES